MNLRPRSNSCCCDMKSKQIAKLTRKSSLLHFQAILTDLQEHTSILCYNRTPGSRMRLFPVEWVQFIQVSFPFRSVSTTINICKTHRWRNTAVVLMNIPEFNQTWLQRAALTVHFLRGASGGAGVPVIYDGNALILRSIQSCFIYDQTHSKVICRSWFLLLLSFSIPFSSASYRWNDSYLI